MMFSTRAFSLIELSIVLVILGLLTGGILTGQSLIRAAQLRTISTQLTEHNTAMNIFKGKYFQLPGDMINATSFWGAEPAANCPGNHTTPSTGTATCNGDGNGKIQYRLSDGTIVAGNGNERYRLWQHLANAGLVSGTFTGVPGRAHAEVHDISGENTPNTRLSNSQNVAFSVSYVGTAKAGWPTLFEGSYGNVMMLGEVFSGTNTHPVINPVETWRIDKKYDDGFPGRGRIRTNEDLPDCHTSSDPLISVYQLDSEEKACNLMWLNVR